jgi:hypothetical protein
MTMLTAASRTARPALTPAAGSPVQAFDRPLTPDELASVIATVRAADHEHGLVAALAVADVARRDACQDGELLLDDTAVPAIPLDQWRALQAVIDDEARRHAPGGESAVLADWVEFGPRVSAR